MSKGCANESISVDMTEFEAETRRTGEEVEQPLLPNLTSLLLSLHHSRHWDLQDLLLEPLDPRIQGALDRLSEGNRLKLRDSRRGTVQY